MTSRRLGYGRALTHDQNLDAQRHALKSASADKIFIEKITGTKASRPELDNIPEQMREGDTVVITRLDRLGRSTKDLLAISSKLEEWGVELEVPEQKISTKTPEGKLFFTMIAAFSQFEHDLMVARSKDGLAAARARGRLGGRKRKLTEAQKQQIKKGLRRKGTNGQRDSAAISITAPTV